MDILLSISLNTVIVNLLFTFRFQRPNTYKPTIICSLWLAPLLSLTLSVFATENMWKEAHLRQKQTWLITTLLLCRFKMRAKIPTSEIHKESQKVRKAHRVKMLDAYKY